MTQPALLLAAHGSPDPAHARTVEALRRKVAVTWPGAVAHGFLDHDQPLVGSALLSLAAGGSLDVIAVPLLLTPAYHRRVDIPAAVDAARRLEPSLNVVIAPVLAPSPLLLEAAARRLAEAGVRRGDPATALVVAGAGSGDADALQVVENLAQAEARQGWWGVVAGYASGAGRSVAYAVRDLRSSGAPSVAVAPLLLARGRLASVVAAQARGAGADVVADVLGAGPEVASLVIERAQFASNRLALASASKGE